jgi:hypothetical protein
MALPFGVGKTLFADCSAEEVPWQIATTRVDFHHQPTAGTMGWVGGRPG